MLEIIVIAIIIWAVYASQQKKKDAKMSYTPPPPTRTFSIDELEPALKFVKGCHTLKSNGKNVNFSSIRLDAERQTFSTQEGFVSFEISAVLTDGYLHCNEIFQQYLRNPMSDEDIWFFTMFQKSENRTPAEDTKFDQEFHRRMDMARAADSDYFWNLRGAWDHALNMPELKKEFGSTGWKVDMGERTDQNIVLVFYGTASLAWSNERLLSMFKTQLTSRIDGIDVRILSDSSLQIYL